MPKKKKNEPIDPNNLEPEDRMKFEIATELGLADKVIAGGWRSLTSKESGRIGGMIAGRKREIAARQLEADPFDASAKAMWKEETGKCDGADEK